MLNCIFLPSIFLSILCNMHPTASTVCNGKSGINLIGILLKMMSLFLAAVDFFSHYLWLSAFVFIVLRVCWASWIYRFLCTKYGKFSAIISPFSPLLLFVYVYCYAYWCPMFLWDSLHFSSFFSVLRLHNLYKSIF